MILILLGRKIIQVYTSEVSFSMLQNRASNITGIMVATISLVIWFGCGLILAYWVKKNREKGNLEGKWVFLLIILTSFIGFIIYMIISSGETGILENNENFSEINENIKEEEKDEFYDEVEEISEEAIEDIIDNILNNATIKLS
ncbi:MAG: hypothetical protein R3255_08520 [Candidatus Lokiarchaeia archaeon]|nr:hypothetical protein [Candidatus Lokiarchaeia archaeon]